jgi:uncharacterized protein YndB with AHSA1/START domain
MFIEIAIAAAVVVVGILAYAATRPNAFRVQRSATIRAPADRVFAVINDFHRWAEWSPWEKLDPALKRSFSGPAAGPGSIYEWVGNNKVGTGRMEILGSAPSSRVEIKLDFLKPFEAHNLAEFTLTPQGESTEVRWLMHGPAPFMTKLMTVFISMDKLIGKDFEAGLANLKAIAER